MHIANMIAVEMQKIMLKELAKMIVSEEVKYSIFQGHGKAEMVATHNDA